MVACKNTATPLPQGGMDARRAVGEGLAMG